MDAVGVNYGDVFQNIDVSLGAVVFEIFLYGIYFILFVICAYMVLQRRHKIHWVIQVLGLALFVLASADIAYTMWLLFGKFLKGDLLIFFTYLRPKYWLYVTNSFFADTLLLYRCYIVWNRDKRVVIVPAILLIATPVCGYAFAGSSRTMFFPQSWVYLVLTFVLNVTLTALTASRIWWVSRKTRNIVPSEFLHRYNGTMMILIESGFIYSLYMVLDLSLNTNTTASMILDIGLIQIVGIMPTLILAQVCLGRASQDAGAKFTTAHIGTYINGKESSSRSTPVDSIPTKGHIDVAGSQSDISRSDRHLNWSTAPCLQTKEQFTAENRHGSHHHLQYPNNNNDDQAHHDRVKELDPESGLKRDQYGGIVVK